MSKSIHKKQIILVGGQLDNMTVAVARNIKTYICLEQDAFLSFAWPYKELYYQQTGEYDIYGHEIFTESTSIKRELSEQSAK